MALNTFQTVIFIALSKGMETNYVFVLVTNCEFFANVSVLWTQHWFIP